MTEIAAVSPGFSFAASEPGDHDRGVEQQPRQPPLCRYRDTGSRAGRGRGGSAAAVSGDGLVTGDRGATGRAGVPTADLLNLEVDLLFFDTTSTYFERDEPDPEPVDEDGVARAAFRAYGHSKDHREDLPQVVVGLAVTRTGIPIRCWCWPGNQGDQPLIRQVKDELREWKLARVVWVADRGFQSAENRRYLQRAGGHYIIGEKLRGESKEAKLVLARQGRYHTVAGNLEIKEVRVDEGTMRDRFVVCRNPEQAERDRVIREQLVAQLEQEIADSDRLDAAERAKLAGGLQAKRALKRFVRRTPGGLLRIDRAAVKAEAHLDEKFLVRSSDPTLTGEDIALGYKQLLQGERARDMKTTLDLRPVHHRKEDRIRSHIQLCWLALLLIRIAENQTGETFVASCSACTRAPSGAALA